MQWWASKVIKGLEHLSQEEELRGLGLLSWRSDQLLMYLLGGCKDEQARLFWTGGNGHKGNHTLMHRHTPARGDQTLGQVAQRGCRVSISLFCALPSAPCWFFQVICYQAKTSGLQSQWLQPVAMKPAQQDTKPSSNLLSRPKSVATSHPATVENSQQPRNKWSPTRW